MLFYENMLWALMSLVIGIAIGSVLSKLFLELLVSMMGLNLNVHFEVPMGAIIDTAIIFLCDYPLYITSRVSFNLSL